MDLARKKVIEQHLVPYGTSRVGRGAALVLAPHHVDQLHDALKEQRSARQADSAVAQLEVVRAELAV